MTTNEAAERLREGQTDTVIALIDLALAAERRAMVERIRVRMEQLRVVHREDMRMLLDEEAAR